jgi:hypothetical protein
MTVRYGISKGFKRLSLFEIHKFIVHIVEGTFEKPTILFVGLIIDSQKIAVALLVLTDGVTMFGAVFAVND